MKHIIVLNMGDTSGEGHGRTRSVCMESSLAVFDLSKAFSSGCKKIGFNITQENSLIKSDLIKELEYQTGENLGLDHSTGWCGLDIHTFAKIYMLTAFVGNHKLIWKVANLDIIDIGGYELFSEHDSDYE